MTADDPNSKKQSPVDLEPHEKEVADIFASLPDNGPGAGVDAALLAAAADPLSVTDDQVQTDFRMDTELDAESDAGFDAGFDANAGVNNVVPLYQHEADVSFVRVLPKFFVAAAVLVLAVTVVPMMGGKYPEDANPVESSQQASVGDSSIETVASAESSIVEDGIAEAEAEAEAEAVSELSEDTDSLGPELPQPVSKAVQLPQADADLEGEKINEAEVVNTMLTEAREETTPALIPEITFTDSANASEDDARAVADGVARTTIISTESSRKPSVVQGLNVTGVARVQRESKATENELQQRKDAATAATEDGAEVPVQRPSVRQLRVPETKQFLPSPLAASTTDSANDSPADSPGYRRSLHRWKAEILKLTRQGKLNEAGEEYNLFRKRHPGHAINLPAEVTGSPVDVPTVSD